MVAIIGAGPYGLSIAAHLKGIGVDFRIFGSPMRRWLTQMPKGMYLKSEGPASCLFDPHGLHTLERYCASQGTEPGNPVSLDVFSRYAVDFQRLLVPDVEDVEVTRVRTGPGGFTLQLGDGRELVANRVIVATGLDHAAYTPPSLEQLPVELATHSAQHRDLTRFSGKEVTVVGSGQSALELAVLLVENGAFVRILVRKPAIVWNRPPSRSRRTWWQRLRHPKSKLGEGLELWVDSNAPSLFRHLPESFRIERSKYVLGPAGAWWLKERLDGRAEILLGYRVEGATARGDHALLEVRDQTGTCTTVPADHVIAATGYQFDLRRLPFLDTSMTAKMQMTDRQPRLSPSFESSVPGLYFTGLASANTFGPAMRFLHGSGFTARQLSRHIAQTQGLSFPTPDFRWARMGS